MLNLHPAVGMRMVFQGLYFSLPHCYYYGSMRNGQDIRTSSLSQRQLIPVQWYEVSIACDHIYHDIDHIKITYLCVFDTPLLFQTVTEILIGGTFLTTLVFVCTISWALGLGLANEIIVASSRAILQLTFLGFVLVPIFKYNSLEFVLPYLFLMTCIAAWESTTRSKYVYPGLAWHAFVSIGCAVTAVASGGLIALGEGLNAQYAIPICGMVRATFLHSVILTVSVVSLVKKKNVC
jgi:hypothetical protein